MALQNFEKDFRKKLREREIDPSAASWDKLEAQLETQNAKKVYSFWWIGIAACIAGAVLMLDRFYFVSEDPTSQEVVESPVEAEQTEEVPGAMEIPAIEETAVAVEDQEGFAEVEQPVNRQQDNSGKPEKAVVEGETRATGKMGEEITKVNVVGDPGDLISAKIEEVVAEVALREQAGEVTDAEIEALLHRAAAEIENDRTPSTRTAGIDHRDLLLEVEMELERSFREKVLDLLKEGYIRTRTAVANRGF